MNNYVFWGSANSGILPAIKLLVYRAIPYNKQTFHNMKFVSEEAQHNYTALRFPQKAEDYKGQQVQKMNYDAFIRTMAEMVKKYAPKMLN